MLGTKFMANYTLSSRKTSFLGYNVAFSNFVLAMNTKVTSSSTNVVAAGAMSMLVHIGSNVT